MEYYNINNLVSNSDCRFLFSIGARSIGKSYAAKKYILNKWKYKKEKFIYIRRTDVEIKLTADGYFSDVLQRDKFKDLSLSYRGHKYYINGEVAGYAYRLGAVNSIKSSDFLSVTTIIFDEFISEDGKYLGAKTNPYLEIEKIEGLYNTVNRLRFKAGDKPVKFIFLANSVSIINPYFSYYGFDKKIIEGAKKYKIKNTAFFELSEAPEVTEYIKNSKYGKSLERTDYGSYAIDNSFTNDDYNFVVNDIPKHLSYMYTICYINKKFGVWVDKKTGLYYITEKYDPSCLTKFSLTNDSHDIDTILINNNSNSIIVKTLKAAYSYNKVRFKSIQCKYILLAFLGI